MLSSKNNFTIVIVTFKSEKIIEKCLNSIDQKYAVIIVENSSNINFKKSIESKFPNVKCYLTGSNIGMGSANNIGIKLAKTIHVMERWPSGLRRTLGKRVYPHRYRGFESHSLRQ